MKRARDLTVKETIKALRICFTCGGSCSGCPLYDLSREKHSLCDVNSLPLHAANLLEEFDEHSEEVAS